MPSRSILRVQQNHPDMDGPYRPFNTGFKCCGAARHCGIFAATAKFPMGEFTQCGPSLL
jgi:hypothetical protein